MNAVLKQYLPVVWALRLRCWVREKRLMFRLYASWRELQTRAANSRSSTADRLLIVPCEPWSVIGSRGDEAMIVAAVQHFRRRVPGLRVAVITADPEGSAAARRMGFEPLEAWRGARMLENIYHAADEFDPAFAVVLGADVMDGYYSPVISLVLLATADLLARRGTRTSLLGFSFNQRPAPSLRQAFGMLDERLHVNVRDPLSLERVQRFSAVTGRLVADTAFLLEPDANSPRYAEVAGWIAQRRVAGDRVLAVNVHPMLIRHARPEQVTELAGTLARAFATLGASHPLSLLLLPHDYRERVGDNRCLTPMAATLSASLPGRVLHVPEPHSAAQLKALVGLTDGLVSSRMHLLIAALGMGLPVAAFTYQDKFQGLFRHFELPEWLLFAPQGRLNDADLSQFLARFVESLHGVRAQVAARLPTVRSLAQLNVDL